jgi:hypothetical protein
MKKAKAEQEKKERKKKKKTHADQGREESMTERSRKPQLQLWSSSVARQVSYRNRGVQPLV